MQGTSDVKQLLDHTLARLLQHFAQLKWLSLRRLAATVTATGLEGAPSTLQTLRVEPAVEGTYFDRDREACLPVRLPQLTGLRDLSLQSGYFYPSVLADMQGLQEIELLPCAAHPSRRCACGKCSGCCCCCAGAQHTAGRPGTADRPA